MRRDLGAELSREHLRAQANAQKRALLPQRNLDPVDLAADMVVGSLALIGPPKMTAPAVVIERFRQRRQTAVA